MPGGRPSRWGRQLLAGLVVFGLSIGLFELLQQELPVGQEPQFFYLAALLALLLASLFARFAMAPRSALRWALGHVVIWMGIGLLLVTAYSYRQELREVEQRVMAELLPAHGQAIALPAATTAKPSTAMAPAMGRSMRFTVADDGQFHVDALIGFTTVRFILDTGASEVMLSQADARRLGFDPANLSYTRLYRTANGTVRGAPLRLPAVEIGPIRMLDVDASVLDADAETSLLGMSFLSRLSSYQVNGPTLTLMQ